MTETELEENKSSSGQRNNNSQPLAEAETLRRAAVVESPAKPAADGNMATFWRVFGGTMLSIVALAFITVFNQFSSSLNDVRRDLNAQLESRSELIRKADLDHAASALWTELKGSRVAANTLENLNEKTKALVLQLDRQAKSTGDDRKELLGRIEENRKFAQEENRELGKKMDELRKTLDDERKDYLRKLDEQRKAGEEDRKELTRKFEEKQKWSEEQNKELTGKLQGLAERLAAVESLQNAGKSIPVQAVDPGAKKATLVVPNLGPVP